MLRAAEHSPAKSQAELANPKLLMGLVVIAVWPTDSHHSPLSAMEDEFIELVSVFRKALACLVQLVGWDAVVWLLVPGYVVFRHLKSRPFPEVETLLAAVERIRGREPPVGRALARRWSSFDLKTARLAVVILHHQSNSFEQLIVSNPGSIHGEVSSSFCRKHTPAGVPDMNRTDLVTLRMYPWTGPELAAGQYMQHDGARAKTAYFVVSMTKRLLKAGRQRFD